MRKLSLTHGHAQEGRTLLLPRIRLETLEQDCFAVSDVQDPW